MNNYNIVVLGSSGVGKTVYLASMFHKLSIQRDGIGFYLATSEEKKKLLAQKFNEIKSKKWPKGTTRSDVSEWKFTCRVQSEIIQKYSAATFSYWDYAGGLITDVVDSDDQKLYKIIENADVLIGILDGHKIYSEMKGRQHPLGSFSDDLDFILPTAMNSVKPIHFIITKWDLFQQDNIPFRKVRDFVVSNEDLRDFVNGRIRQSVPIRLIPVSSVGKGFAKSKSDGTMHISQNVISPRPFQVEMPFACILPDGLQGRIRELDIMKKELENRVIDIAPQYTFWDTVGRLLGGATRELKGLLPKQYKFGDPVLYKMIDYLEKGALKRDEDADKRAEELLRDKEMSLRKVKDEDSALEHVVRSCLVLMDKLRVEFPESDLSRLV